MAFDKELVAAKLRRWEKYLREYRLPEWDRLPDLGLYMEQVTVLMRQYLDYLPPELKEEQFITASTINNYVRMKIMPEPRRKRYYRIHLAYLIVILTLKQSLSITMIRDLLPPDQPEEEMEAFYRMYTARHRIVSEYFVQQVRAAAGSILDHEQPSQTAVENASDLIIASAMVGGLTRLLAEKLLLLEGQNTSEAAPAAVRHADGTGYIHMVGALPACRGKGIGHAMLAHALEELQARACPVVTLTTDDHRLAAIKTYLDAGFRPVLRYDPDSDMRARWDAVIAALGYEPVAYLQET